MSFYTVTFKTKKVSHLSNWLYLLSDENNIGSRYSLVTEQMVCRSCNALCYTLMNEDNSLNVQ